VKDSFLIFLDISESNHQDTSSESQVDETHFCKVGAMWWMFMTLPFKLLQQGCYLLGCVGSSHHATFIFLAVWSQMPNLSAGVPEALSKWFCLHSPQFCAEGIHCLITCDE
jgi:hypothetical protein